MSLDKTKQLPIYQKAMHLVDLVDSFMKTIPEEDEYLQFLAGDLRSNSYLIPAKIAGAEGGDLYSIRMQNAAIIRQAAMDLMVQIGFLRFQENFTDVQYVELIRGEIEEFRLLFVDWVDSFDQWNYIKDEWGLFNPPGVSAHDKDPDDDIPFDPMDFFGDDV